MVQGAAAALLAGAAREIEIKDVLPGHAAQRARLDLGQVDVAQRKGAQAAEQQPRLVDARQRRARSWPRPSGVDRLAADGDKAGIVGSFRPRIRSTSTCHAIDLGRALAGDGRRRRAAPRSRIRRTLPAVSCAAMASTPLSARQRAARTGPAPAGASRRCVISLQLDAGVRDEAVRDAQVVLGDDVEVVLQQQVIVAMDAARQRVLHRHHAAVADARLARPQTPRQSCRRARLDASAVQGQGRLLAIGAGLALKGDAQGR